MWKNGEHNLNMQNKTELENLRSFLKNTYYSSKKNEEERTINLHVTTNKACYSFEINKEQENENITEQINSFMNFITNPEEVIYRILVLSREVDCEFNVREEVSPYIIKMLDMANKKLLQEK